MEDPHPATTLGTAWLPAGKNSMGSLVTRFVSLPHIETAISALTLKTPLSKRMSHDISSPSHLLPVDIRILLLFNSEQKVDCVGKVISYFSGLLHKFHFQ